MGSTCKQALWIKKRYWVSVVGVLMTIIAPLIHATDAPGDTRQPGARSVLVLVSDQFCPYVCSATNPLGQGYMVDFARAALSPVGIDVRLLVHPWPRAMRMMQAGKVDGVIAVTERRAEGWLLSPPLGIDSTSVMSLEPLVDGALTGANLTALNGLRIAQASTDLEQAGNPLERYLKARLMRDDNRIISVSSENPAAQMLKMLVGGRVDAVVDNSQVLAYTAASMTQHKLQVQGHFGARPLYIALTDSAQGARASAQLAEALQQWRADGRWAELLGRYGLVDLSLIHI